MAKKRKKLIKGLIATSQTQAAKFVKKFNHYHKLFKKADKLMTENQHAADKLIAEENKKRIKEQEEHPQYKYVERKMSTTKGKSSTKKYEKVKVKVNPKDMTAAEKKAFLHASKRGRKLEKAIAVEEKKRHKYHNKMIHYSKGKAELTDFRFKSSISKAKTAVRKSKVYNSFIVPNDAKTDHSYLLMMVSEQSDDHSTNVATTPVEHGMNVATTSQMQAPQISVTAQIAAPGNYNRTGGVGDGSMEGVKHKINRLQHWSHSGADMYWSGPHEYTHCVISDISTTYNWSDSGSLNTASITMTLTVVNYFDTTLKSKRGAKRHTGTKGRHRGAINRKKNTKHYVIAKSGTTYAYIASKKGVSVADLQQKNSYESTKIPIGAKIYY